MLIEVVALQPPHYYQGIVTIQFKKLLTGEPGEVNSLNSIFRGGFTQEQSCYRTKCGKSFHGDVPCFALHTVKMGRVKTPAAAPRSVMNARAASFDHLVGDG